MRHPREHVPIDAVTERLDCCAIRNSTVDKFYTSAFDSLRKPLERRRDVIEKALYIK